MATKKVNELPAYAANPVDADLCPLWDTDAETLKHATVEQLKNAISGSLYSINPFTSYVPQNISTALGEAIGNEYGDLFPRKTGETLASGDDITFHMGTGKVLIVVNAGADIDGTLTITGTSVDRDTGAETAADTEEITVDALTTDNTSTTALNFTLYDLAGAYVSNKFFKGDITISTTNLNLSDVDIYHLAYETCHDLDAILRGIEISLVAMHTSCYFEAFLYTVQTTGSKVTIESVATLRITSDEVEGDPTDADEYFTLRKTGIDAALNGATNGFFLSINYGPPSTAYWRDISTVVWVDIPLTIT